MSSIEERLLSVFQAAFPTASVDELRHADATTLDDWDSMATLTVISLVQEEFDVDIEPDEAVELLSFKKLEEFLSSKQS